VELADENKVLFVFSLGTSDKQCEALSNCLRELDNVTTQLPQTKTTELTIPLAYDQPVLSFDEMKGSTHEVVPLDQAVHRVVAEMVTPYPPGIPFLLPGEKITSTQLDVLHKMVKSGAKVRGLTYKSFTPFVCVLQ
jgi:arginine/lysine/ornithine decarboxylase